MASLAELLAEDGFTKKGRMTSMRTLPPSRAVSMPLYPNSERAPPSSKLRRGRTQSYVYRSEPASALRDGVEGGKARSKPGRRVSLERDEEPHNTGDFELRNPDGVQEAERSYKRYESLGSTAVGEIEEHGGGEIEEIDSSSDSYSDHIQDIQRYKRYMNSLFEDEKKIRSGTGKKFVARPSFSTDNRRTKKEDLKNSDAEMALDEAAIRAVISILAGYARRFFKDDKYRESIRRGCYTCLSISGDKANHQKGSGAVTNLREAMETIERVVQEVPDPMELKKASLKLSVVTGLSSKDLKDGYTSGISNSDLAACAHVYLGIIYKFQKKDRVAAKHLLQVFCESPCQARTALLPGLWDHIFFPHLSHLKTWYERASESITKNPGGAKKMQLLDKVYSNTLDMGTYQFADYYKKWLMREAEAPELPSVQVPSASFPGLPQEDFNSASSNGISSPYASISSQPMVSKRLYDSVFSSSKKVEFNYGTRIRVEEVVAEEEEEEEEEELRLVRRRSSRKLIQEDDNTQTYSTKPKHGSEHSPNQDPSPDANERTTKDLRGLDNVEVKGFHAKSENISSRLTVAGSTHGPKINQEGQKNELTLKRLAQAAFQLQQEDEYDDASIPEMKQSANIPVYDLYQNNLSNTRDTETKLKSTGIVAKKIHLNSTVSTPIAESSGNFEDMSQDTLISRIPMDFICPITGQLFKDPVTLETGQTFERAAIKDWFDDGKRTCPVTGRELECLSAPVTNFVLKRVIDGWKSEYCRDLLIFALQVAGNTLNHDSKSKDESALLIIEHLLTGLSIEEQMENAKHLLSLGGLHFLLQRFELGDLEEKTRVASLILCCIKADGSCRSYLAMNIGRSCILELLHSKQISSRTHAVLLLIELICLDRRIAITSFIGGLQTEAIVNTMHVLLVYLQSSQPEQKVLVAVLLLHLDLMVEPQKYSIYREEAVNSITLALDCCLSDKKVIPNTRRALLMLGGHFSSFGEILTESWLLKQAGFYDGTGFVSVEYEDEVDENMLGEEEAKEREDWSNNVAFVLLGTGNRSFLEILSKCLGSENTELVSVCLTTVAWLSRALAFQSIPETQTIAFSDLIPRLKEILESDRQIEHRVLATASLLNFSKIPECRYLLMTSAEEICNPLKSLTEVTWTAKHLYTAILEECL